MQIDPVLDPERHFTAYDKVLDMTSIVPTSVAGKFLLATYLLIFLAVIAMLVHGVARKSIWTVIGALVSGGLAFGLMTATAAQETNPHRVYTSIFGNETLHPFVTAHAKQAVLPQQVNQDESKKSLTQSIAQTYGLDVLKYDALDFGGDDYRNITGHVVVSKRNASATSCDITTFHEDYKPQTILLCSGNEPTKVR